MIEFTTTPTGGFITCNACHVSTEHIGVDGIVELRVNPNPDNPNGYTALRFCPACLKELAQAAEASSADLKHTTAYARLHRKKDRR
mgnify:CR=1 FL=1